LGLRLTDCAAIRKAWPERLWFLSMRLRSTLPPEMSFYGANPNQVQQCFSVGQALRAMPISARIVWAVLAFRPALATRSTPAHRYRRVRAS